MTKYFPHRIKLLSQLVNRISSCTNSVLCTYVLSLILLKQIVVSARSCDHKKDQRKEHINGAYNRLIITLKFLARSLPSTQLAKDHYLSGISTTGSKHSIDRSPLRNTYFGIVPKGNLILQPNTDCIKIRQEGSLIKDCERLSS